jgi:hypothetical protein
MIGLVVWIASMVLVLVGLAFFLGLRRDIALSLRLRRAPTAIAAISGPGTYHVRGRALASEQGMLKAPLTRREALVYRVYITVLRSGTQTGSKIVDTARDQVEFLVDDGSGGRLRVDASDAALMLDDTVLYDGMRPFPGEAPAEIRDWTTRRMGHPRDNVRVEERIIEPGLQLSLVGPVSVDDAPQAGERLKMTSPRPSALFVTSPTGGTRSLLVKQLVFATVVLVLGHGGWVVSCACL